MTKNRGPGIKTLIAILVLILAGAIVGLLAGLSGSEWGFGLLAGWLLAGLLGLSGLWTSRRALSGDQQTLLKYMVGGMLVRMTLCGAGAAVVVATGLTHTDGFILGLLAGIAAFLGVEVYGLHRSARRNSAARSAEGVTSRV